MESEKTSNLGIDILKSIGIILIILAHMGIPKVLFQLRNFDVVLLVILSGFLSVKSYKSNQSFYKYIKKRFIRLIIPVWIFLTIFFGIFAISDIGKEGETFCFNTIFRTYALIDGIGYVWIFRVYMLCAISVPLLLKLKIK